MKIIKFFLILILINFTTNQNVSAQWSEVFFDSAHTINSIYCMNADTCLVAGSQGLLVKTIDGGISWSSISIDTSKDYTGLSFFNDTTGYMLTSDSVITILRTFDGGYTWSNYFPPITCSTNSVIIDCHAINNDTAIFIAGCTNINENVTFYNTYNEGANILEFPVNFPCFLNGNVLYRLVFENDSIGFGIGDYETVYKTINKGITWNKIHEDCGYEFNIRGISCYNDTICWLGGEIANYFYRLKFSTDGGYNWNEYPTFQFFAVRDVAFFPDGTGYVAGNVNEIYKSTDFGNTFGLQYQLTNINPNIQVMLNKFSFLSSQIGYAIALHSILKTTNGGGPVGLGENHTSELIKIFPNPSNGEFTINKFPLFPGAWHVQVYDNMGKLVFQNQNIADKEIKINLSENANGLYFVKAIFGNKSSSGKVVIMK